MPLRIIALCLIALLVPSFAQQKQKLKPPVGVPADATHFNGKWYAVFLVKSSWRQARDRCAAKGGRLAIDSDAPTHAFIKEIADGRMLWLGATDEKVASLWVWSDGSEMTFKRWDKGEPDGGNHRYLYLFKNGTWHDAPDNSSEPVGYICEWVK